MLFCYTNISADILLLVLGYDFHTKQHFLAHFYQMLLPLKASKILAPKILFFGTKNVDEIDPMYQGQNI
jgi:hypothetical protein